MIPYSKQNIIEEDIAAVVDVLKSDYLTQGPKTPLFEKAIKEYTGAKYSIAVINATSALHLACLALDIKNGDLVWTSPISFVASANCAIYCRAQIDFVDIDINTYNISIENLEEKLELSKKLNKLPKLLIVVHLAGQSCDMKKIHDLSKLYGFKIIEDASHAIGGEYLNRKIGNCKFCDFAIFSFHPVKIITTCEGGVCLTNNKKLAQKVLTLRSHGIIREGYESKETSDGSWYYEQVDLGYNYRLNDLQSALGISQLKRIDEFVDKRHIIAKKYETILNNNKEIILPYQGEKTYSSFHLYIIRVPLDKRKVIFETLRNEGIFVNVHYIPIYRHPFYKKIGFEFQQFPNAEMYYKTAISIPIYPELNNIEIERICEIIINNKMGYQNIF